MPKNRLVIKLSDLSRLDVPQLRLGLAKSEQICLVKAGFGDNLLRSDLMLAIPCRNNLWRSAKMMIIDELPSFFTTPLNRR